MATLHPRQTAGSFAPVRPDRGVPGELLEFSMVPLEDSHRFYPSMGGGRFRRNVQCDLP
jgi:hypothetical protein